MRNLFQEYMQAKVDYDLAQVERSLNKRSYPMTIQLTESQYQACEQATAWFGDGTFNAERPIFRIFGYAGTGKTTIINELISQHKKLIVAFASYTGKAAMVMRKQGLPAQTIHSLIYQPIVPSKKVCDALFKRIDEESDKKEITRLWSELNEARKVQFRLKNRNESTLSTTALLVLDECSMVNQEMLDDLLSFQTPIIALGDPGQLPPIDGAGAIINAEPDVMLTEIHRQAEDNPIISYATKARKGYAIPFGHDGSARKTARKDFTIDTAVGYDQILVGKNVTRKSLNMAIRRHFAYDAPYPEVGEKVICLANDRVRNDKGDEVPIFNGMQGIVTYVGLEGDVGIQLLVQFEGGGIDIAYANPIPIVALRAHFDAYSDPTALKRVRWWNKKDHQEFDFGYVITVHKAQGSQWDTVLLYDDEFLTWKRSERAQWLYTAITRARLELTIIAR